MGQLSHEWRVEIALEGPSWADWKDGLGRFEQALQHLAGYQATVTGISDFDCQVGMNLMRSSMESAMMEGLKILSRAAGAANMPCWPVTRLVVRKIQ